MATTFIIGSDLMGSGNQELGQKILGSFFRKVADHISPVNLVFYNTGVQLLAKPSPFLADLSLLAEKGAELIA
ncbi:MAG: sulfurtransferase-like selenium metabolism protein YedF, partial [Nitrospinota bacterium]